MFVILCRQAFVPFDDAKVRRFFHPAMDFCALCAETAPFVDQHQRNGEKLIYSRFS
jgi:hypothetical protein